MTEDTSLTQVDPTSFGGLEDILGTSGADAVVTPDTSKFDIPKRENPADVIPQPGKEFPDDAAAAAAKVNGEQAQSEVQTDAAKAELEKLLDPSRDPNEQEEVVPKPSLAVVKKLIEAGTLKPFEDEKPIDEYTEEDIAELIQANLDERDRVAQEETPKKFFDSLPDRLKYAAQYVANGGQDLQGLFAALAEVERVNEFDATTAEGQEVIARSWLQATGFGTAEEIAEEVESWKKLGTIEKKAASFKPRLDEMTEQRVQAQVKKQEAARAEQVRMAQEYRANVANVLKAGDLGGLKISAEQQADLYTAMTETRYQSLSGRPTNELGFLLDKYQFGEEPDYGIIAEALMLLRDRDGYRASIRKQVETEVTTGVARRLKTDGETRGTTTTAKPAAQEATPRTPRATVKRSSSFREHFATS